ncbi:MAG TPA: NAD-dependent epimerase/dehydratase family protein, partial [Spirochaetota bacterium]|nr:NAD-dependent epimerase/dehydratase family protein [Spirochaetota bacterium]
MKILVTGTAGFIGSYTVMALLENGHQVVGIDSINDYYDPELKYARLAQAGIDREDIGYGSVARSGLHRVVGACQASDQIEQYHHVVSAFYHTLGFFEHHFGYL